MSFKLMLFSMILPQILCASAIMHYIHFLAMLQSLLHTQNLLDLYYESVSLLYVE